LFQAVDHGALIARFTVDGHQFQKVADHFVVHALLHLVLDFKSPYSALAYFVKNYLFTADQPAPGQVFIDGMDRFAR